MKSFCNNIAHSPVSYKLLIDITALWTLFSAAFFIADFILPGVLSLYISVGEVISILLFLTLITIITARLQNITYAQSSKTPHTPLAIMTMIIIPFLILSTNNFVLLPRIITILLIIGVITIFYYYFIYTAKTHEICKVKNTSPVK